MGRPPGHSVRRGRIFSRRTRWPLFVVSRSVGRGDQGELRRFRGEVYDCFDRRADALFDLIDGVCTPITVAGVAYVSLAPGARRGHGAGYARCRRAGSTRTCCVMCWSAVRPVGLAAGLRRRRVDVGALRRGVLARARFLLSPVAALGGQPIVAGWCYSWLVGLSAGSDSWTAPLDARAVGVSVTTPTWWPPRRSGQRCAGFGALPQPALFAFDGGYDPVQLTVETGRRRRADRGAGP